jgi:chitinase
MKKTLVILTILCGILTALNAQLPRPALVGYWHNWQTSVAPYIALDQVDSRYNVIAVSFALPAFGTDYNMTFAPDQGTVADFKTKIQTLQNQGKRVILSVGGATASISLSNTTERDVFASSMLNILTTYGFDGMDIDIEGNAFSVSGGTIASPIDVPIIHMIAAVKTIMKGYFQAKSKQMILTMAPETAYVQGGMSAYSGIWGAYLPVIHGLRDSLSLLHVQLYNTGSMYGIDGNIYTQGNANFIIAMTEAMIKGFMTNGGMFTGLPESKVAIGLPACPSAAGGGFTNVATVASAVRYLKGAGAKPSTYTLAQVGGYPNLGGMMTWSVNWDAVSSCNAASYAFAQNYQSLFTSAMPVELLSFSAKKKDGFNEFNWSTTSEINTNNFELQRLNKDNNFETIATIKAQNKAANYSFTDDKTADKTSARLQASPTLIDYYRLKINDFDGKSSFSKTISVENGKNNEGVKIYPNPANNVLFIENAEGKVVEIVNILGQKIKSFSPNNNQFPIAINELNSGIYFIKIDSELIRFIKN